MEKERSVAFLRELIFDNMLYMTQNSNKHLDRVNCYFATTMIVDELIEKIKIENLDYQI